jgi:ComF family protein
MSGHIREGLAKVARGALDYALPPRCPGCGIVVTEDHAFCHACWGDMRFLSEPCCVTCGLPFEFEEAENAQCGGCLAEAPPWTSARAALAYGPVSSHVAMRLKYGRRIGLARLMARHMAPRIAAALLAEKEKALVIPVPLHRWRIWSRGFNQAAVIGDALARLTGLTHDPLILKRTRATRPLRDLGTAERAREVRRAFALDPARGAILKGKKVLLIDDIHTSGATARACTRTLMEGGAEAVHLLCWARVLQAGD